MFAPVLLEVPGQMTRCPCGFGAYALGHYNSTSITSFTEYLFCLLAIMRAQRTAQPAEMQQYVTTLGL